MHNKLTTLTDAIATIPDGACLALGGNTLHRGPCAAVHELIRQKKRGLEIVKTAGAYDIDVLCGAGCATAVTAGFVGFETVFGMAPNYRRAVEQGQVEAREHACYTVIAGLRAAIQGVPFMPVAGMTGSDIVAARGFRRLTDPFSGDEVVVVPVLQPDVAIIHVHEADAAGNGRIVGTRFEDELMVRAARRVILTTERVVDGAVFESAPETVAIPGFLVEAVVEVAGGARPCSCVGHYEFDRGYLASYLAAASDPTTYRQFVELHIIDTTPVLVSA